MDRGQFSCVPPGCFAIASRQRRACSPWNRARRWLNRAARSRAIETLAWNGEEAPGSRAWSSPVGLRGRSVGACRYRSASSRPLPPGISQRSLLHGKLGAALAAGCRSSLKAAEGLRIRRRRLSTAWRRPARPPERSICCSAIPPAVAARLLAAPAVRKVTFTGSTRIGKELARLAAPDLKRCTFELGGHAPVILCADGDVDAAVAATIPFKFTSAGQSCIAPSRFYLHRSRYAEFVDKFGAAVGPSSLATASILRLRWGRLPMNVAWPP